MLKFRDRFPAFILFCATLTLALAGFYWPWLSGRLSFYLSDLTYYFEPIGRYIGESLRQGRLPLWNPYFYCGMSQVAIPNPCVFYPFSWLFVLPSFSLSQALWMVGHQLLSGVGGYLLVAGLGWGAGPAAAAGLMLALCGYMFSLQANPTLVASAAWLPLCLWSVRKIGAQADDLSLCHVAFSGFLTFMLITSGRPEISLPATLLIAGYVLADAAVARVRKRRTGVFRQCLWRLAGVGAGVMMSMPMILPVAEWTALSPRSRGLSATEVFRWSANWYDCLCFALNQPLGDLNMFGSKFLDLVATRHRFIPYVASAFVGPIALMLALIGILDRSWRWRSVVAAVFVGGLLLALGNSIALFPLMAKYVPALAVFRYPVKLLIVPTWCLSLMAARGMFVVNQVGPGRFAFFTAVTLAAFCLCLSAVAVAFPGLSQLAAFAPAPSPAGVGLSVVADAQVLIGQAGLRAALIALAFLLLVYLRKRRWVSRQTFQATTLAALLATLLAAAWQFQRHGVEEPFFAQPSYLDRQLARLDESQPAVGRCRSRFLPLYFDPLNCPPWYKGREPSPATENVYRYGRDLLLPCINMNYRVPSAFGYESSETRDYRRLFTGVLKRTDVSRSLRKVALGDSRERAASDVPLARFCQMTSTNYVATQVFRAGSPRRDYPLLDEAFFESVHEDVAMNVRIYRVRRSLPRAYFARRYSWSGSQDKVVEAIVDADSSGFDPTLSTWLTGGPSSRLPAASGDSSGRVAQWVEVMQETPEHVSLSVRTSVPDYLVLTNHIYPGWQVRVDGADAAMVTANAVFMAAPITPGSHLVEFDYRPGSLVAGLWLAASALLFCLLLLAAVGVRRFWAMARAQSRGW